MATYREKPGTTLKELIANNRFCRPDGIFCNGVRTNINDCLNNHVTYWECTDGIIYVYTTPAK